LIAYIGPTSSDIPILVGIKHHKTDWLERPFPKTTTRLCLTGQAVPSVDSPDKAAAAATPAADAATAMRPKAPAG